MTSKEMEIRSGVPRANIRYYEAEGLLSPARSGNGYRDYSEEDLRTLEKIKLLRRLSLDLDAIRRLQAGELSLSQALAGQALALEGDRADLERYAQVCEELSRTETSYDDLDPEPWLAALEERLKDGGLSAAASAFYTDLRRYGGCVHSGFGLGFERLIMYLTGVANIRDVIPFPRTVGHLEY